MQIELTKDAVKYFNKMNGSIKLRLTQAFEKLLFEPPQGDIFPLQGKNNIYRLRVGNLRILFSVNKNDNIILISKISPRGDAYKN